jgi:hypothetical protein
MLVESDETIRDPIDMKARVTATHSSSTSVVDDLYSVVACDMVRDGRKHLSTCCPCQYYCQQTPPNDLPFPFRISWALTYSMYVSLCTHHIRHQLIFLRDGPPSALSPRITLKWPCNNPGAFDVPWSQEPRPGATPSIANCQVVHQ